VATFADLFAEYGATTLHELFERLREERPVCLLEFPSKVWLVTRYADCRAALNDARLSNRLGLEEEIFAAMGMPTDILASTAAHMLSADGEDHTRLRRLVSAVFTPRRIEKLRPMIEKMTSDLLDAMAVAEEPDVIRHLALSLPLQVICELIGVPPADQEQFSTWARQYLVSTGVQDLPVDTQGNPVDVMSAIVRYLQALIERKRAAPDDKLLSAMISVRDNEDRLTENELTSMCFLLIIAGHLTTVDLIGNGTAMLLADPGLAARLRAHPETIPDAVEEFLRLESPLPAASLRRAAQPLELAGQAIAEGELVMISLLSANRDKETFADAQALNAEREPNHHMAFGVGIHYCLGASLARLEGEIAIRQLLDRFPKLARVDPTAALKWRSNLINRGLTELRVTLH
jgi:cytochrome P450